MAACHVMPNKPLWTHLTINEIIFDLDLNFVWGAGFCSTQTVPVKTSYTVVGLAICLPLVHMNLLSNVLVEYKISQIIRKLLKLWLGSWHLPGSSSTDTWVVVSLVGRANYQQHVSIRWNSPFYKCIQPVESKCQAFTTEGGGTVQSHIAYRVQDRNNIQPHPHDTEICWGIG